MIAVPYIFVRMNKRVDKSLGVKERQLLTVNPHRDLLIHGAFVI